MPAFTKLPNFPIVTSIGIVRDAEESAIGAFNSVRGVLERAALPVPNAPERRTGEKPSVSVMILPGENMSGMLETLLWKTIGDDDVRNCIDQFFGCVEAVHGRITHRPHKARARAFLATQRDPHLSVGDAAKRGSWDLDHIALEPVHAFLREMASPQ